MNVPLTAAHVNASSPQDTNDPESRRLSKLKAAADYAVVQNREACHRLLATSLASHSVTRQRAAAGAGVSRTRIDQWCGADDGAHGAIQIGRLLTLGQTSDRGREAVRSVLIALLAQLDPTPGEASPEIDLVDAIDSLHAEVGDVSRAWREAWADRTVTPAVASRLDRELADVVEAATAMRRELARNRGA